MYKIAVIEDDTLLGQALVEMLTSHGYQAFVAESVTKARRLHSFVHGKVFDTTDNKKRYAKELGKPVLFVGIGVLVSGIIAIIVKNHSIPTAAFFLVIISGITGLWLHKIQKSFRKF